MERHRRYAKRTGAAGSAGRLAAPRRTDDPTLNGSAPDNCSVALLLIDLINRFDFAGGSVLLERFEPAATSIARLKSSARRCGIPAIYVNDNFGRWRSDFHALVTHCIGAKAAGLVRAEHQRPERDQLSAAELLQRGEAGRREIEEQRVGQMRRGGQ